MVEFCPTHEVREDIDVVWQIPPSPKAVLYLAHSANGSPFSYWPSHPNVPQCTGTPEHKVAVKQALDRGFAVIASKSVTNEWETWPASTVDIEKCVKILKAWRGENGLDDLPLSAWGTSCGGDYVSSLATAVKMHSLIVMISHGCFEAFKSAIGGEYPATLFVPMTKDQKTFSLAKENIEILRKKGVPCAMVEAPPCEVHPHFFAEHIDELDKEQSAKLHSIFVEHGIVSNQDNSLNRVLLQHDIEPYLRKVGILPTGDNGQEQKDEEKLNAAKKLHQEGGSKQDGPPGKSRGGPTKVGPPHEGPPHEGPPHEGPPREGPPHEGPPREGPPHKGSPREGPPLEGPREGPPHKGSPREGPPLEGPPHEGSPHEGSPHGSRAGGHGPPSERRGPPHEGPPHEGSPHEGPPHEEPHGSRVGGHGPPSGRRGPHEGPPHQGPHEGPPHGDLIGGQRPPFGGSKANHEGFHIGQPHEGPPVGPSHVGPPHIGPHVGPHEGPHTKLCLVGAAYIGSPQEGPPHVGPPLGGCVGGRGPSSRVGVGGRGQPLGGKGRGGPPPSHPLAQGVSNQLMVAQGSHTLTSRHNKEVFDWLEGKGWTQLY